MFNCWILLKPVLGAWAIACTYHYRPWTGLIKPSLQHLQFYCLGLSLGILFSCIIIIILYLGLQSREMCHIQLYINKYPTRDWSRYIHELCHWQRHWRQYKSKYTLNAHKSCHRLCPVTFIIFYFFANSLSLVAFVNLLLLGYGYSDPSI